MNIGITGSTGFIGGTLVKRLEGEGFRSIPLDDFVQEEKVNSTDIPKDLAWVLHFGARTSIKESFQTPFSFYLDNLKSTLKALHIASVSSATFLFMSSYVYGKPKYNPIDEKHPVDMENPYMASKIAGELACQQFSNLFGYPLVILRAFNIYGNHNNPGRLISDLLMCMRNGDPLSINDPSPSRDYIFIRDFSDLILKIVSKNPPKTGIFNVGSGVSHRNLEVAEIIRELIAERRPVDIKFHPRPNEIPECIADITAVCEAFDWSPRYSLKDGLGEIITTIKLRHT